MHFHFSFTAVQILWTLTFAALLVLLSVLVGRERMSRFPWFTVSIALLTLRLLVNRLLYGHIAQIPMSALFFALAGLAVLANLLVLVEVARRAFHGAGRRAWIAGSLALLATAIGVVVAWGPWPPWKTVSASSELAHIRLMQLVSQHGDLLAAVLAVELGLLVVLFGHRFHAGWRTHTQRIAIGLSAAAMALLATRGILETIGAHTTIHSHQDLMRAVTLQARISNANSSIFLAVLIWWIACLWIDEPPAAAKGAQTDTTERRGARAANG
jgi:hypothetical protein